MNPSSASSGHTRPIQSGRRTGSTSSTSEHGSVHHSNGSSTLMPPDQTRPRSSSSSKALLTKALLEAQSAVQLDNANEIPAALEAYRRAVGLLSRVMDVSSSPEEHERLKTIHNSYLYRIQLLSTPTQTPAAHQNSSSQSRSPPPSQSNPQPRQPAPQRSSGGQTSLAAATTPASSSTTSQRAEDSDSAPTPNRVAPALRRTKKHATMLPPSSGGASEPRMLRQRADSTSASELHSNSSLNRHHVRSHTGGSHRMAGDLIHADLANQRTAKIRRDHLGVPIHSAPTAPLPPTPSALGPPPSTPPPVPVPNQQQHGSVAPMSMHSHSNSASSISGSQSFLASVASSTPPKSPLPPAPSAATSPPGSPANVSRRVSPLVPTTSQQQVQQQQAPLQSTEQTAQPTTQSSPKTSTEDEKSKAEALSKFYDDDLISEEWLPNLSTSEATLDHALEDPYPRERMPSKGTHTGGQSEPTKSKATPVTSSSSDELKTEEPNRLSQQQQQEKEQEQEQQQQQEQQQPSQQQQPLEQPLGQPEQQEQQQQQPLLSPPPPQQQQQDSEQDQSSQHQRSYSQSSSSSKSPLNPPMYAFQQGSSSITSLHALENTPSKRTSDSSRSLKEGSPLARSSGGSGTTNGSGVAGSSSPLLSSPVPPPPRPTVLQHQYSSSKLSATLSNLSNSNASSPTLDKLEKSWSPSLNGSSQSSSSTGGATLFDVISDDPFVGMSFPLPPPFLEPPPSDPYLRCFWLMRRLEQTMTTGGFLTKRMYVPKAIWYQSLIRLPAAESKMNACQTLSNLFSKLAKHMQNGSLNLLVEGGPEGDAERMSVLKELESLETAAHQMQSKLSKKLSYIHRPGKNGLNLTIATNQGYNEEMQGPVTGGNASVYGAASLYGNASHDWLGTDEPPVPAVPDKAKKGGVSVGGSAPDSGSGLKSQWKSFSKSVQKSIGNDKIEDTSTYTETVMRLFQSSYILESMLRHYNVQAPQQTHLQIVSRLRALCQVLNQVICAFVVRDLGELMGKYVKRVGAWVTD